MGLYRWFEPADEIEHRRAMAGADLSDYCRNCGAPFMEHHNGTCPPEEDDSEA